MEEGAEGGQEGQAGQVDGLTDLDIPPSDDAPARWRRVAAHPVVPYAVVVVATLVLTRSFWLPGSYVAGFDTFAYSGPHLEVTERAVRDGRIPLLNDTIFGGVPQLGNPQAGVWYPAHLLLQLFETNRAMNLAVVLHALLLGVGATLLAGRLGAGRLGAAVSGLAVVGSGAVLVKTVQFEQMLSIAWAPLLLAALHATLTAGPDDPVRRPVAAVAVTTAAVVVAGHPQLAYQTAFLALAATIGFAVGDQRWRRLPHVAGGVGLGLLLAAPAVVAAVAATADSRLDVGRTFDDLRNTALSVESDHFLRALLGTPQRTDPALFAGGSESIGFLGVTVLMLAVVGAARAVTRPESRPWAISLLVAAVLAGFWSLGPRTGVFRIAYDVVPGFDLTRASGRWLVVVGLVVAMFAGLGVHAIVERTVRRSDVAAAALVVAVAVVTATAGVFGTATGRTATVWIVLALAVVAAAIVVAEVPSPRPARAVAVGVVLLAALELAAMSRTSLPQLLQTDVPFTAHRADATDWLRGQDGYTIALTDDGRPPEYLVPGLRPNANTLLSIPSIDGYDGGVQVTERWATSLYRFSDDPMPELPMRNSLAIPVGKEQMARLGVRFMLLDVTRGGDLFLDDWGAPAAIDRDFWAYENPAWIGEAIAWRATEAVPSDRAAADLLRTDADRLRTTALVDDPSVALDCPSNGGCEPVGLTIDERTPEHLVVRTALDEPSVVMVPRQALSGWEVRVDGRGAEELTIDGLFLGVEVPAGDHVIEWRYRSPFLAASLVIALIAAAVVGALAIPWQTLRGGSFWSVSRWRRAGR